MQKRLFTSPAMKVSEVKDWCKKVRENKGKVQLTEMEFKSALNLLIVNKTKAAS